MFGVPKSAKTWFNNHTEEEIMEAGERVAERIKQEDDIKFAKTAVIFMGKTIIWIVADTHPVLMVAHIACSVHTVWQMHKNR
jgi:hypothetical protein